MLLEISTTHTPAGDLGYLLHKHPGRVQTFKLAFGDAHVFYPVATAERCVAALLIDVDPVALVRGKGRERTRRSAALRTLAVFTATCSAKTAFLGPGGVSPRREV